jgi:pimeloyl-ACP methyl ester carboxylesterase
VRALPAILLFLLATLAPASGQAQRWLTLPPTPSLPSATSHGYLTQPDARLYYEVHGGKEKPAVLLLHGGGANTNYWAHLVRDLGSDFQVVVMDSRGQGRSTHEGASISYELMAADGLALLDHLGIKQAAVVGWSDGANIGFYLALRYPQRITALAAFAGNATPAGYQPSTNPELMSAYVARTRAESLAFSPDARREREKAFTATMLLLGVMWRTQPTLTAKDLASIKVRTAILHAEHDEIIRRAHAREIATGIPGAKFVPLAGVSHFALLQDPKGFNAAVKAFLAGN